MNSLKVPEGGLMLDGTPGESPAPPQAFVVSLSDDVINQMIQSARNGDDLHLSTGKNPTLLYGSKSHRIAPPADEALHDLYLTKPFESTRRAERMRHTGTLFKKLNPRPSKKQPVTAAKENSTPKPSVSNGKSSTSSGLDSDIEALQNGLAAHDAARERAQLVDKIPVSKNGLAKSKNKPRPSYNSLATKSMPNSPALNGGQSPVLTASQQVLERKKEQRVVLVHELAVKARSTDYLRKKWPGRDEDFMSMMEKTADYDSDSKTWTIRKSGWKELDVWKYDYASREDRQAAIDNAIRQYDKQRLSSSEVEWERLLPKEERGKGKCLSRLQANLARGPVEPTPKIKVQKAEESSASRDDESSSDKAKAGGEKMARSSSNPLPTKPKKSLVKDTQPKRLLNKPKVPPQKPSPTKARAGTGKGSGGRVLSAAIIENSDSSGDEAPAATKAAPKPVTAKPRDTVVVNTKPPIRAPMKQQPPAKRPREEEDSSSSSGTPLSKRIKPKQPLPAPVAKPRLSHAGGASRQTTGSAGTTKPKNTSPTKSSPLASSPPTNASDLEDETPPAPAAPVLKKRKAESEGKPTASKRRVVESVPADVMSKAHKFKTYYQKYEALHYEVSALDDPPESKLADLLDMRGRLQIMKKEIYKQCSPDRD
ncbi:COM1 regulatory protein [Purpureocillium lavendulum]|uniref:COM1 regulatory protein n=1 Tax=Purpureocillium lavendulum TaxID=1247861 RepID=A0AB34FTY9_9HYPO|nr:COM1 regulatory protein [Purpureocillium lavendulum]